MRFGTSESSRTITKAPDKEISAALRIESDPARLSSTLSSWRWAAATEVASSRAAASTTRLSNFGLVETLQKLSLKSKHFLLFLCLSVVKADKVQHSVCDKHQDFVDRLVTCELRLL